MSSLLSVRLDPGIKSKLESLAKASHRSKSFLAAEAIAAYVEAESWQIAEIHAGIQDLDEGRSVPHEQVRTWLASWGKKNKKRPPR